MKLSEFFSECRNNDVFKNLSIYVVSSWVLLQVVSLLAEPLNLPNTTLTFLLLLLLIGFPLYAYLLWIYRIKPENRAKKKEVIKQFDAAKVSAKTGVEIDWDKNISELKNSQKRFQKMYFSALSVMGLISLLFSVFIIKTNFFKSETSSSIPALFTEKVSDKIAVLQFDNNTGEEQYDLVGKMAVDWIMHGITQNKVGQVISPKIIDDYSKVLKASLSPSSEDNAITKFLKPSKIIDGSIYLKETELLFQASITNENMSETLMTFGPIRCSADSPLDCIEELKQRILGFLVTEGAPLENLQASPPKYEAYRYLMEAKNRYGEEGKYLEYINKAIAIDSTFFEAKIGKMEYYYNRGDYHVADSMVNTLSEQIIDNDRQKNLLRMYESLLKGNNGNTYTYLRNEYSIYPYDLETNTSLMTVALQFVNRPEDVEMIYQVIPNEEMNQETCTQCGFRYRIKGLSDIELGNYQNAIDLLVQFEKSKGHRAIKEVIVRAKVRAGKPDMEIERLISDFKLTDKKRSWQRLLLFAGREYAFANNDSLAQKYLNKLTNSVKQIVSDLDDEELRLLGYAHLYSGDYEAAEKYWQEYIDRNADNRRVEFLGLLAISYHKNNKPKKAEAMLQKLEDRRKKYMFGHVDYTYAQYYAAIGDDENVFRYLMRAVAGGKWFEPNSFQNDVFFKPYLKSEEFDKVLNFWKS